MLKEVVMPKLSALMKKGKIIDILVKQGDYIKEGETILSITAEKANVDIESPGEGYISLACEVGEEYEVGEIIATISKEKNTNVEKKDTESISINKNNTDNNELDAINEDEEIFMPKLSALMKKGKIIDILVKQGDYIKEGEAILSITAEKANVDIESPGEGYVSLACEIGEEYEVGEIIATISKNKKTVSKKNIETHSTNKSNSKKTDFKKTDDSKQKKEGEKYNNKVRALPIVKKIAKENKIDLREIKGTGSNGLILKKDIEKFIESTKNKDTEIIELDSVKKSMFEHMELSKNYVKGTTFMDVNLKNIKSLRSINKYSYTTFIVHAVSRSIDKFPLINSMVEEDKIIFNKNINLGVALDYEGKLFVPVIKNADKLNLKEINTKIKEFVEKAKKNKISYDDLSNGTFSITNSGVFGSLAFAPIINYPQSAILGVGKIEDKPVVVNGEIVIRPIMIMSLSYDHRIIEGSIAVKFLASIKNMLENMKNEELE